MQKNENLTISKISYEDIMSYKNNLDISEEEYQELEFHYTEHQIKEENNFIEN